MNKNFLEYLRRVEVQFRCKDTNSARDDDKRLYLYCRLLTVSEYMRDKMTCIQCAEWINVSYLRDIANNETWWRTH
jgi:hypothetical protein